MASSILHYKEYMQLFSGKSFKRLKHQKSTLEKELIDRMSGYILGAFGLIAGLAWNDAIKGSIEYLFPLNKDSIPAKFLYAIIMTILVVFVTLYAIRLIQRSKK